MTKPQPLDLLSKWQLVVAGAQSEDFCRTVSELRVLIQLLQHQNPKTGQCNPSYKRLSKTLKLSPRTISTSVASLERHGVLEVRRRRGSSNRYRFKAINRRHEAVQSCAKSNADLRSKVVKPAAHKKRKEKKKEKEAMKDKDTRLISMSHQSASFLQRAENDLVQALEAFGYTYAHLLSLPAATLEATILELAARRLTQEEALERVLQSLNEAKKSL